MQHTPEQARRRRAQQAAGITPEAPRRPVVTRAADPADRARRQPASRPAVQEELSYYDDYQPRMKDWDPFEEEPAVKKPRKKRRDPLRWLWILISVACVLCIAALGMCVAPQLLGIRYATLPNYAFVNGSIITLDWQDYENYKTYRSYMGVDTIYPGVYIDNVHVGGMTVEEAAAAVNQANATNGGEFAITVNVGNMSWSIDSGKVPMTRNAYEIAQRAYALGRSNTTAIRGTGVTPFAQRLNNAVALRTAPVALTTEITYDKTAVRQLTDSIVTYVNRDPVNATVASFDFNTRSFTFNADRPGAHIDADDLFQQVTGYLDSGVYTATVTVVPEMLLAEVTKAELMNSFRLISSFSTKTTSNNNRNTNVMLSANAINGRTVLPGEVFSFNDATGQRTSSKGYREATAISGGQSVPEVGGGVCQTSSTLFNAVARANLEIVYRSPHAWPSTYVEKGMDATVNWPNLDFKFRNQTDWPIFIVSWYADRKITVEIYGMSLGDGVTIDLESEVVRTIRPPSEPKYVQNPDLEPGTEKVKIEARTGYEVNTWKVWYQNGQEFKRELLFTSTYKMYQQTIEYN